VELRTVEYFLAIAQEGSLRAAAQRLGVTQPALTKAVRRLEQEVGARLFERTVRGVTPTEAGNLLLRHAARMQASLAEAEHEIEALRAGLAGEVRLGAGPTWQHRLLPEALARFRSSRPAIRIVVRAGMDDVLKAELRAGRLDFVLAATPRSEELEPDLRHRPLSADDYAVVAADDHPLRRSRPLGLADLLAFPWILPGPRTQMVETLAALFRAQGLAPPRPVIETDSDRLRLSMLRSGPYLSYNTALHLAELRPEGVAVLDVPAARWRRQAGIITRRAGEPGPAAQALIDTIVEVAEARGLALAA
jgi:DNA-binding transcriptional LysR family regulator